MVKFGKSVDLRSPTWLKATTFLFTFVALLFRVVTNYIVFGFPSKKDKVVPSKPTNQPFEKNKAKTPNKQTKKQNKTTHTHKKNASMIVM